VDQAIEAAWNEFIDAIREADFIADEICRRSDDDPGRVGLVDAWRKACQRRDEARDMVRSLIAGSRP
jgi:hypothetical protein